MFMYYVVKSFPTLTFSSADRLWEHVTYHLKNKNVEQATEEKHKLEQRQREEAKDRKEQGAKWETKVSRLTLWGCNPLPNNCMDF